MSDTVFFSWQSNSPAKTNRSFIEDALKKAIRDLGKRDDELVKAPRPIKLDKDTSGVPGSPAIVDTIFTKIAECGVFVPDLTFVGKTDEDRPIANPNVLIEYGWALAQVSDERIVAVMNSAFGEPDKDTMPFNIAHKRWPIRYHLEEGATSDVRRTVKAKLVRELKGALFAALEVVPDKPEADLPSLIHKSKRTCFLDDGDLIGKLLPFGETNNGQDIYWDDGPQMFLRVLPESSGQKFNRAQLQDLTQSQKLPLLNPRILSSWNLLNEFGFVEFETTGKEDQSSI